MEGRHDCRWCTRVACLRLPRQCRKPRVRSCGKFQIPKVVRWRPCPVIRCESIKRVCPFDRWKKCRRGYHPAHKVWYLNVSHVARVRYRCRNVFGCKPFKWFCNRKKPRTCRFGTTLRNYSYRRFGLKCLGWKCVPGCPPQGRRPRCRPGYRPRLVTHRWGSYTCRKWSCSFNCPPQRKPRCRRGWRLERRDLRYRGKLCPRYVCVPSRRR